MSDIPKIMLLDHHDNQRDDVVSEWLPGAGFDTLLSRPFAGESLPFNEKKPAGCVIYGGEHNLTEADKHPFLKDEFRWIEQCLKEDVPLFGICLGAQMIAQVLGAKVDYHPDRVCEFGYYEITPTKDAGRFMESPMHMTQAHYQGFDLPANCTLLATGETYPNQAFRYGENVYAVQFHPEITPAIFKRWQVADWAMYDSPGSQTMQQQTQLLALHGDLQTAWFRAFLQRFFVSGANS